MSIGFYLLGEFKHPQLDPNCLLRHFEEWIQRECVELSPTLRAGFVDEKPCLFANFHPAGEEVEICLIDPCHLTVSANTSTVGPGYHIYLCDLFQRWTADFSIGWKEFDIDDDTTFGDEAGYFFSGDQQRVFREMEIWLRALAGSFFDGTMDSESVDIALCMRVDVRFVGDSLAITQLGPRNKGWVEQIAKGLVDYREFFAWYDTGLNANYYLGRALVQMWSDVRWRKPANDSETVLLRSVSDSLEAAYRMNPSLHIPWNEWSELLALLEGDVRRLPFVKMKATGPGKIGYRRKSVKTLLSGNWWIETDGSFSTPASDPDGTLSMIDPPREIWFTAYSFSADHPAEAFAKMRSEVIAERHELIHESENYVSVADISRQRKGNYEYYLLKSSNVGIQCRSVCTLVFEKHEDRDWAIGVWRSLKAPVTPECKS